MSNIYLPAKSEEPKPNSDHEIEVYTPEGQSEKISVAVDLPLKLVVNGKNLATIYTSPVLLNELVIGHLYFENIIQTKEQIKKIEINELVAKVQVETPEFKDYQLRNEIYTSECISKIEEFENLNELLTPKVERNDKLSLSSVKKLVDDFNNITLNPGHSLAVHTTAITDAERILLAVSDISRHASFSKIIGWCIINDIPSNAILTVLSTGRVASDMVLKVAKFGIPVIISIRGPLYSGYITAERSGITLISFVRGIGSRVITHFERVKNESMKV